MNAGSSFVLAAVVSLAVVACSSSDAPPARDAGSAADTGHTSSSATSSRASSTRSSSATKSSCASTMPCTGALTGGVHASVSTCSVSGEDGLAVGFGEVTFTFTATGDGGVPITGSGNISTTKAFAVGSYAVDAGLWNDTGSTGTAADSLWTVAWSAAGTSVMSQCNGIASPDETPSLCQGATLTITSVDACDYVHGSLALTIPAYMGSPEVGLMLAF